MHSEHSGEHKEWHNQDGCIEGCVEWPEGTKEWYKGGKLHRIDGPAIEYANGIKAWYRNGEYIKSCNPKILTIKEDETEKQVAICCIECVRCYKHISEDRFHKLILLL